MALFVEGLALMLFSRMTVLPAAIGTMIVFSLFVQMSEGATYSVVPFMNKKALGSISGIVGAGGNMGAVAAGFLLRAEGISYPDALLILGVVVMAVSFCTFAVRFSASDEKVSAEEHHAALRERARATVPRPEPAVPVAAIRRISPLTVLRVYLGCALAIKGVYFITDMKALEAQLGDGFGEVQNLIAWFVVFAHAVGGVALALGFVTRVAATLNAAVMVGATVIHVSGAAGTNLLGANLDFQFSMLVLVTLIVLMWRGADRFSLDRMLGQAEASPRTG